MMNDELKAACFLFIIHHSSFILSSVGRCGSRTRRSDSAPTVFGTACRARAQPSGIGRGARTRTGKSGFGVRQFAINLTPLHDASGGIRTPTLAFEPQLYRLLPS